jgi:thymidylate synthase (FAD)
MQLITDPHFKVYLDPNGSSPSPSKSIWTAQHVCYADGFAPDDNIPEDPAQAIIKHQLKVKHWSVLEFGYAVLHYKGFPHSTVMQLVRHQDSSPLCQSGRYTGKRFIGVANETLDVREVFYFRPLGEYTDRQGNRYEYTAANLLFDLSACRAACKEYSNRINSGWAEEHARDILPQNFRQNFTMAGTIRAIFHWLDQRTLADSQLEAQTLAAMALKELEQWEPGLFKWYENNRAAKNMLAP